MAESISKGVEVRPDIVDRIDKTPLTPGQQAYSDFLTRTYDDDLGPKVAELARQLYQMEVKIDPNYQPFQMDWAAKFEGSEYEAPSALSEGKVPFRETATLQQLERDMSPIKISRTEQGFLKPTVERRKDPDSF